MKTTEPLGAGEIAAEVLIAFEAMTPFVGMAG
jgi:hypothetical protein